MGANIQFNSATFNVVADGTGPLAYQWYLNSNRISGATSPTYTRSNVRTRDLGEYSVQVTNSVGAVVSATMANSRSAATYASAANTRSHSSDILFMRGAYRC